MPTHSSNTMPTDIDDAALRQWPLPDLSSQADKEERGRVLLIGGSREIPGAAVLAACAAFHAGAGKVAIATIASMAPAIAIAVPEARVIALPETPEGDIQPTSLQQLDKLLERAAVVLIGPGMQNETPACELVAAALDRIGASKLILDACAMNIVRHVRRNGKHSESLADNGAGNGKSLAAEKGLLSRWPAQILLTPHAGEMAHLAGISKEEVMTDPDTVAQRAAQEWHATVAMKGPCTYITAPDGRLWRHEGGNIGLAVSGSGDALAGIIAGLAARGATLEQACAWGIALHARAGERLAARIGPIGYLARDISAEVPMLMHQLSMPRA